MLAVLPASSSLASNQGGQSVYTNRLVPLALEPNAKPTLPLRRSNPTQHHLTTPILVAPVATTRLHVYPRKNSSVALHHHLHLKPASTSLSSRLTPLRLPLPFSHNPPTTNHPTNSTPPASHPRRLSSPHDQSHTNTNTYLYTASIMPPTFPIHPPTPYPCLRPTLAHTPCAYNMPVHTQQADLNLPTCSRSPRRSHSRPITRRAQQATVM
ncbi:hypothetical protein HDK77DRAFT_207683 [Phyllosticta capitalensis]|uniref:Uncharacterized protein n=1 Tax=Phyllosticta capitalensis TaxID=121624 RepID=A0ABR1Z402_9PEZI